LKTKKNLVNYSAFIDILLVFTFSIFGSRIVRIPFFIPASALSTSTSIGKNYRARKKDPNNIPDNNNLLLLLHRPFFYFLLW